MESGDVRGQKSCYDISRGGIIWQEKKYLVQSHKGEL